MFYMNYFIRFMVLVIHMHGVLHLYFKLVAFESLYKVLYAVLFYLWGIWLLKKSFEIEVKAK